MQALVSLPWSSAIYAVEISIAHTISRTGLCHFWVAYCQRREAISEQVRTIVEIVHIALEQMPPELAADIVDNGIVLTGGGSLLKNLDMLIREEMKLPIIIPENPLLAVVRGSGEVLGSLSILKDVTID